MKREAILHAAARLFIEDGYTRATMSDVAKRLNITKPALYHYFRNKEEVLFECYRMGQAMTDAALARISDERGTGLDKVRRYIRSFVAVICEDAGALIVRVEDRELSPELRMQVRRWKSDIDLRLRALIVQGVQDGSIRACDAKIASFAISGALNWIGHWYRGDGELDPTMIGMLYAGLLTEGLAAQGRPSARRRPSRHEDERGGKDGSSV